MLSLVVTATPARLPKCPDGELLVSNGEGYQCASFESLLEKHRGSGWGAKNVLPTCSSGEFLQSEGFGSWRCVEGGLVPRCSSGERLRSEGSSGWRCAQGLPSCSSGQVLVAEGGGGWSCKDLDR